MNKMTAKQEKFCIEYLIDLNATQAAIRAGYSKKTANIIGTQNLSKLSIKTYIENIRKTDSENAGITREMVLDGYKKLAFYDSRKFYDAEGNLLSIPDLDGETSFALSGFEVEEIKEKGFSVGFTKKIKMSDRKGALDSISKVLGFNAPTEIKGKFTLEQITGMTVK